MDVAVEPGAAAAFSEVDAVWRERCCVEWLRLDDDSGLMLTNRAA